MQNPRVVRFFSVFEKSVQDEIMSFCNRLTSTNSDVYIIMARKAAAFCDCLEELGLIHLDGYVTSDRSLDICGDWLTGKDITIIDDAVVSGTTLYTTIQKLRQARVREISIQILTVNEAWYTPELLQDENGKSYVFPVYNKLSDNICIKLCNDIVQAISLVPRPYDVDFPLYRSITISEYEIRRILVLNNWETHDLRTDLQKQHGIFNFTLLPNQSELRRISKLFGLDFTQHCNIKIRIYGRVLSAKKKQYSLRISPFVIFREMSVDVLHKIFYAIISDHSQINTAMFSKWESASQLRFLQFYYSHQLATYWLDRIGHLLDKPIKLDYSYRNLSFLFPEQYIPIIKTANQRFVKLTFSTFSADVHKSPPYIACSVYKEVDPISINARLYEPFLEMYHDKEIPCRKLVKEQGKHIFNDDQYKELRNRLNQGLSFQDLEKRLSDCNCYYDVWKKVSLFIDYSIDAGIIVPIVQQENNIIFRAYRHGEDVLFGRREEMMYTKMLSLFAKYSDSSSGISKVSAEKMIVLFSKIGLREKILYPYTSNFCAEPLDPHGLPLKVLRVKPYLKGPVSIIGSALQHQKTKNVPYITHERKSMWLTNVLIQNGYLIPNADQGKKIEVRDLSNEVDLSLLTESELTFVQNFAELMGRVNNPSENTGNTFKDNDWAKISVTLTLPETITAVAAEMELFGNEFSDVYLNLRSITGHEQNDLDYIKRLRKSHAFEAINSAIMKIQSFSNKEGQKLIQSIRFPSTIEQRVWLSYFSEELNSNSDENNATLCALFYGQKVWVNFVSALVYILLEQSVARYTNYYGNAPVSKAAIRKISSHILSATDALDLLKAQSFEKAVEAKELFKIWNSFYNEYQTFSRNHANYEKIFSVIHTAIEKIEPITECIKESVCDVLGERGKIHEIVRFNHVIHIGLRACPEIKRTDACAIIGREYSKIQHRLYETRQHYISKGIPVPIIEIRELPQIDKPTPLDDNSSQDMWFIAHGPRIDKQVFAFITSVFYNLYRSDINCQITMFERLSYENSIKSNSSEFATYHCNQFNTFIEGFKEDILFPKYIREPCIIHVCPSHLVENSNYIESFSKHPYFRLVKSIEKHGSILSNETYKLTQYNCTLERKTDMSKLPVFDFGIITILPEEMDAVIRIFSLQKLPSKFGERVFYTGKLDTSVARKGRRIVCLQAVAQGETSVISAYHDMVDRFHPKFVFLVGIAGGIAKPSVEPQRKENERAELDLCDVVIANSIIDYETSKEDGDILRHRGRIFPTSAESAAIVNDFLLTLENEPIHSSKDSKNETLHVLFEPIGSGNRVIGNELSETRKWLASVNNKVAAVEMEATGINSAFYESRFSNQSVQGLLVVRGISDMADVDKSKSQPFRKPAAQNAAIVVKKIMEMFPKFE